MDAEPSRAATIRLAWHAAVATTGSAGVGASLVLTLAYALRTPPAPGRALALGSLAAAAVAVTWAALGRTWGLVLPAYRLRLDDVLSPGMDANYGFLQAVHRGDPDGVAAHLDRLQGRGRRAGPADPGFAGDVDRLRAGTRRRLAAGGAVGVALAGLAVLTVVGAVPQPGLAGAPLDRAAVVGAAFAVEALVLLATNASVVLPWVDAYTKARTRCRD